MNTEIKSPFLYKFISALFLSSMCHVAQIQGAPSAEDIANSPTLKNITQRGFIVAGSAFKYKNLNIRNPSTGKQEGFYVDVGKALARYMLGDEGKIKWRYAAGTALGNVLFVDRGDVDLLLDPVAQNPDFKKVVNFSDPVLLSGSAFLVKKGSSFRGMENITDDTTVIYDKSNTEIGFVKAKHPDAKYIAFWDTLDVLDALQSGKGDVFTTFYPGLLNMAARYPEYMIVGRYTDKYLPMCSKKDDLVFLHYLNGFLKTLKDSGEYDRIYDKWLTPYGANQRPVGVTAADLPPMKPGDWAANNYVAPDANREAIIARAEANSPTLARIKQRGALIVGNAFKFQRFSFPSPDRGEPQGFMVDLTQSLARHILGEGGKVIWKVIPDEDDVTPVQRGDVDAIIDIVYLGAQMEKLDVVNFSEEIFRSGGVLLVRKGSFIQSLNDITDQTRILSARGGEQTLRRIRVRAPNATYLSFATYDEAFAALKEGKGDLVSGLAPYLFNCAVQDQNYTLVCKFLERPTSVVSRKDDPAFNDYINDFLRSWRSSGQYEKMFQKWFVPYGGNMIR
ncbi:MAG: transporter substrate-binding domain-containing protein [Opitutaceae bacterium]|nr:transporter substrate-binding domain-containing protein [Opitutaceae bacterium]